MDTFERRIYNLFGIDSNIIDYYVSKDRKWSNIVFDKPVMVALSGTMSNLLQNRQRYRALTPTLVYQRSEKGVVGGELVHIKVVLHYGGEFPYTSELFSVRYVRKDQ